MTGIDNDADAPWPEHGFNAVCDLCCQFFLDLEATRECLDNACQLADADNLVTGQVTDVGNTDDRCHVVFAV